MKICLITSSTKKIDWEDFGYPEWIDSTAPNHRSYAKKWDLEYIASLVDGSLVGDRHPTWLKIHEMIKVSDSNRWDWIVWIDADAVFVDDSIDIRQWLTDDCNWVLPKMQPDSEHGKCWTKLSTGLMAMRVNHKTCNILNRMWVNPDEYRWGGFHEQSWIDAHFNKRMSTNTNLNEMLLEDLEEPLQLGDLTVLPYKYHLTTLDREIPFVFHAGGDTPTKHERIKKALCI